MIFLDLDGVFADYRKGFHKVLGRDYYEDPKAAWPILDQVPNLFATLEPLPYAKVFFNQIHDLADEFDEGLAFLTALPLKTNYLVTADSDKEFWTRKHLDARIPVICVPGWRYKKAYARVGSILIDDSARNIKDWNSSGATGIVHFDNTVTIKTLELLLSA